MDNKIYEFTYRPKVDKSRANPLFCGVLLASLLVMLVSINLPRFSGVVSLFAVAGLCSSLYLYTRYVASTYAYTVSWNSSGEPIFIVTKLTGERASTMFSVELKKIISIQKFTKSEYSTLVKGKKVLKHNYIQTYGVNEFFVMKTIGAGAESYIMLECTAEVAGRILEYAAIAREVSLEEE